MVDEAKFLSKIERVLRDTLGTERVRSVDSRITENRDDAQIVLVQVVIDADISITPDEMGAVQSALWFSPDAPFPVISFRDDTEIGPVAAE